MNVLLLGGTGAMGRPIARLLELKGYNVFITSRSQHEGRGNTHFIYGNAHDYIFLEDVLHRSWDVIIDFMVYTTEEFENRYKLLINSCGQYIFISSSRVYSDSEGLLTETSSRLIDVCIDEDYLRTDEYALAKGRQENYLFDSKKGNFTIIRPYITYNDNRLQLGVLEKEFWLYRALHDRSIVFSKDIMRHVTTLTWGDDVARGITSILGVRETYGEAFHITNSKSITWEQVLMIYENVLQKYGKNKPPFLLEEALELLQGNTRYQVKYDRLYNRMFDNTKINKFIDVNSFIPPEKGLESCLINFIEKESFSPFTWYEEARRDKITGEWANLTEIKGLKNKYIYYKYRL